MHSSFQLHTVLMQDVRSQFNELLMLRKLIASRREHAEKEDQLAIAVPPPPPPPTSARLPRSAVPIDALKREMVKRMTLRRAPLSARRTGTEALGPQAQTVAALDVSPARPLRRDIPHSPIGGDSFSFRRSNTLSAAISRANRLRPVVQVPGPVPVLYGGSSGEDAACGHAWHSPRFDYAFDTDATQGYESLPVPHPHPSQADMFTTRGRGQVGANPVVWEDDPAVLKDEVLLVAFDDDEEEEDVHSRSYDY